MPDEALRVVGYVRVSTDNQLENYSIEEQTGRLRAFCAARGWTLLRIYTDGGYSGGNTNRPALQEMLSAIREGSVGAVVVYKLDRLSRSQKDTLSLIEDEFLAHKTDFVSINENFDTSTPFGRAMIGLLSVFAQLEKDQITERFTMGRIGRGRAGYFHGGGNAPTGYDYRDGLLHVNEYEAMQVREVFELFLSGKSINAIARGLSARYTTGWTAAKVRNVLKNSLYTGKVHFLGEEYPGRHQPLVDAETFAAANRLLCSAAREQKKNTAQKNPFRAGYLLSGLVRCGRCGARYAADHGFYKCYSRSKCSARFVVDPDCKNDSWPIAELDAVVTQNVEQLLSAPGALERFLSRADGRKKAPVDRAALARRLRDIERQTGKLIDLYQVGQIPMDVITERIEALTAEKSRLSAQLSTNEEAPAKELFVKALDAYRKGFADGDTDKRRLLLSSVIESVTVTGREVAIHWRL